MIDGLRDAEASRISEYFDLSPGNERPFAIWVIGRPGAGKTTTATLLRDRLRHMGRNVGLVDGEAMRALFDGALGHSESDRLIAFNRLVCVNRLLQSQGIIPITATIAGFNRFREIARSEIDNIRFIFLECPFEVAAQRDQKGIYSKALEGKIKDFYGVDLSFESPARYECELKINSAILKPLEIVAKIVKHFGQSGFFCEASGASAQAEKIKIP